MMRLIFVSNFCVLYYFFFFKQKTAYEMRISYWSSDVCSSDLTHLFHRFVGERRTSAGAGTDHRRGMAACRTFRRGRAYHHTEGQICRFPADDKSAFFFSRCGFPDRIRTDSPQSALPPASTCKGGAGPWSYLVQSRAKCRAKQRRPT